MMKIIKSLFIFVLVCTLIIQACGKEINLSADNNLDTLEVIHAHEAWEITKGSDKETIAVIDSGVVHSEKLPETIRWVNNAEFNGVDGMDDDNNGYIDDFYGWDFVDDDNDTSRHDETLLWGNTYGGHGTQVTSVISAAHDGSEPLGIAPDAKIMILRVNNMRRLNFFAPQYRVITAIEYAIHNNATIINLDILLLETASEELISVLKEAVDEEVMVVSLTQNYAKNLFTTEINDYVIGVNSQWDKEYLPDYQLPKYDIFADGFAVPTIGVDGSFKAMDGTSPAVPQVSATIALMLSVRNDLPKSYIGSVLQYTTTKMEILDFEGQSRTKYILNIHKAVNTWQNFEEYDLEFDENGYLYKKTEDTLDFSVICVISMVPVLVVTRKMYSRNI
ncbi:MAG: S8 family serine peptidase [Candidatus Kariarchaeaceae archaeon]|jgi:hypothetical protein